MGLALSEPLPEYAFPPLVVPDADAVAERIAVVLQEAWDRVEAEKERLLDMVDGDERWPRIRDRLESYQREIEAYQDVVGEEALHMVALVQGQYANGMVIAAATLNQPTTWSQGHRAVLAQLANDTYDDFLAASVEAGRTTAAFAREIRRVARDEMPFQATGGKTAAQVARDMRRRLEDEFRISSVTYRDGSVHEIGEYTRMASRTKGRVAFNSGSVNGYYEARVEYLEVFDGGTCGWSTHQDPVKANGTIRTIQDCSTYLISHPNCRRAFGPRPDVTAANIASAKPLQDLAPYIDEAEHAAILEDAARSQGRA